MDAYARFVRLEILAREEAHIVRCDHRTIACRRELQRRFDIVRFVGMAGAGQLDIPAIVEMTQPGACARERGLGFSGEQQMADVAVAASQRDQTVAAAFEPGRIDQRMLAVAAFDIAARDQARKIQITRVVLA